MARELLVREARAIALARMEDAARTEEDFKAVVAQWDHLDANRERRERQWEKQRTPWTISVGYKDGMVFPIPFPHTAWKEAMKGDFLSIIYDNADEMWQLIEDWDVASVVKNLTSKQREILYLRAVRLYTAAQIASSKSKTDRAVRKLYAATLKSIRDILAPLIREQIETGHPHMTLQKRVFVEWYGNEKTASVDIGGG
jgi:DNA-directed RNA polymerase specialized sigma24 family protein